MGKKKDPSITFLNKFDYNVVRLPRVGIEPMDVIGTDTTTQWLGPLRAVWKSSIVEPVASAPRPAAALVGQQTDQLEASFGLKILANALAAFGAAVPSIDFAYSRARKVQFSYVNVTSIIVSPFDAGNYLAAGTLNTTSPVVQHYFSDPDAQAFLIMDVLKSDSITVTATDDHGASVDVDVPAIQGVVGAKVGVKANAGSNGSITYNGPAAVTFGFIVDEIEFDGTKWFMSGSAASGLHAFAAAAGGGAVPAASPIMLGTGCRVRI